MDLLKDINQRADEYTPTEEPAVEETVGTMTMLRAMGDSEKEAKKKVEDHKKDTKDSIKAVMKKARKKMGWK